MHLRAKVLCCLFCAVGASSAWADSVDVSLSPRALIGKGLPSVNVHINEPIAGFRLKLKRSDGKDIEVKGGGNPGQTRNLELAQPEGRFGYVGELTVNQPDGTTSTMPLAFDAELFGPLRMKLGKEDVHLAQRKLGFRINRPVAKAHLKVLMDTGKIALDDDILFNGEPADTRLEVSWPEAAGKVMKISLQVFDTFTFFTGVELSPWQVDIPHEEVNFDTGKWDIRPEEEPKLDRSARLIAEAVGKYGKLADIKLYVAGHTDSVGSSASNRTLSINRARSIGGYFKRRGLRIPVHFEGFGEDALLVATPDETDELRNRRAEYILSIDDPALKTAPFSPKWQKL